MPQMNVENILVIKAIADGTVDVADGSGTMDVQKGEFVGVAPGQTIMTVSVAGRYPAMSTSCKRTADNVMVQTFCPDTSVLAS